MLSAKRIRDEEFYKQIDDIVEVGLRRFAEKREAGASKYSPFVLYEKYSRRDVSLLMNCGKDLSSTMYGMKRIGENCYRILQVGIRTIFLAPSF